MLAIESGSPTIQWTYYDESLEPIWSTVVPRNDDEALDYFAFIERFGPTFHPAYVERNGLILPYRYDGETIWIHLPGDNLFEYEKREVVTVTEKPFQVKPLDTGWDFI